MAQVGNDSAVSRAIRDANILNGLTFTHGYVTSSGTINTVAGEPEKTMVSQMISNPMTAEERYVAICKFNGVMQSGQDGWMGIGFWDNNDVFRARSVPIRKFNMQSNNSWLTYFDPFVAPYTDGKVRVSFRTYGDVETYIVPLLTFAEILGEYNLTSRIIFTDY